MPDQLRPLNYFLHPSTGVFKNANNISAQMMRDFALSVMHPQQYCQGRLTTETNVPVSISNRIAQSTLFYTPYNGNLIGLYDGQSWGVVPFAETSFALTGLTSARNYDVFAYNDAGTLALELSPAWTTDITRADALTTQDGVLVKSGATTRRYIGTIRTTGTTTIEDSARRRFVWNCYNRTRRYLRAFETNATWTYTTDTWRQANALGTNQVEIVNGIANDSVNCQLFARASPSAISVAVMSAIGYDSVTTPSSESTISRQFPPAANAPTDLRPTLYNTPDIGYHFYAWLERSGASGTTTWTGVVTGLAQCGIHADWDC